MTPEEYIQRLFEVTSKKHKNMQDILSITKAQTETIHEDGIDDLERLVTLKQNKIDEIDKLDEHFNVYFMRLKQEMKVKSLDELKDHNINGVKELQKLIGEIMELVKNITEAEKHNQTAVKGLMDHFSGEIRKINQSKKVQNAYNSSPAMQPPSYFIDSKK